MTIFLVIALVVTTVYLLNLVLPYFRFKVRNNLRLSESIIVELPLERAQEAVLQFFGSLPHSAVSEKDGVWIYERGILGILRLNQIVLLHSVPHLVGVGFRSDDHHTVIEIGYRAMPTVKFSDAASAYFLESALNETRKALEALKGIANITRLGTHAGFRTVLPVRQIA